jgi:hypothetical protein
MIVEDDRHVANYWVARSGSVAAIAATASS